MDLDLVRHLSEARIALVPPVSIEDRPLLWMVVRSQTYYPESILIGGGDGGGLSTTLSPRLRSGGLESKF